MKTHFSAPPEQCPAKLPYHQRPAVRLAVATAFFFFLAAASPNRVHHLDQEIHHAPIHTRAHAHAPNYEGQDHKGCEFLPAPPHCLQADRPAVPRVIQCLIEPGAPLGLVATSPLRFSATLCDASARVGFSSGRTLVRQTSSRQFGIFGPPLLAIRAPPSRAS